MKKDKFLTKIKSYFWETKDLKSLKESQIVERVLNYGTLKETKELMKILGPKKVASCFFDEANKKRSNYRPEIKNFFSLIFKKHV